MTGAEVESCTTNISVQFGFSLEDIIPEQVKQWVQLARGELSGSVCVRFMDVVEAHELNERYRNIDRPTNVLAFGSEIEDVLGDIAVCVPIAAMEANDQQKTLQEHLAHLVIHGTLHLCGYDHQTDSDTEVMEQLEIQMLTQLGYQNPYE